MRIALAALLVLHGFAHLVGFVVSWQLTESAQMPYKTTLLGGRVDVGDAGMRVVGTAWLLLAVLFVVAGAGSALRQPWWVGLAFGLACVSFVASAASLPEARIGVLVNVVLVAALLTGPRLGWW